MMGDVWGKGDVGDLVRDIVYDGGDLVGMFRWMLEKL